MTARVPGCAPIASTPNKSNRREALDSISANSPPPIRRSRNTRPCRCCAAPVTLPRFECSRIPWNDSRLPCHRKRPHVCCLQSEALLSCLGQYGHSSCNEQAYWRNRRSSVDRVARKLLIRAVSARLARRPSMSKKERAQPFEAQGKQAAPLQ
jgi:hypothetical protein